MDKITVFILLISTTVCFHCVFSKNETLNEKCDNQSNKTCGPCVEIKGCSFCVPTQKCASSEIIKDIFHGKCPDNQWKVGQCVYNSSALKKTSQKINPKHIQVTGKILLIVLPSVAGAVLIALCCCIYCCCCRKKKGVPKKEGKQEAKWRRQREDIDMKHAQRRAERQVKYDEIRKKYGLYKNGEGEEPDDGRYHQFTNEA